MFISLVRSSQLAMVLVKVYVTPPTEQYSNETTQQKFTNKIHV